jgi:hypothetical protein
MSGLSAWDFHHPLKGPSFHLDVDERTNSRIHPDVYGRESNLARFVRCNSQHRADSDNDIDQSHRIDCTRIGIHKCMRILFIGRWPRSSEAKPMCEHKGCVPFLALFAMSGRWG